LSEIYTLRDEADEFLHSTLSRMKNGAVLVVVDFQHSKLVDWIEDIAADCELATKSREDDAEWVIDPEEEKTDLAVC
jgi:hypothetical protein